MSTHTSGAARFGIEYIRATVHREKHFVPGYARHRPACQAILGGDYYEPKTHALVTELMAARPGNIVHAGAFFGDTLPSFSRRCRGVVYAFEPVIENFILAKMCVQANRLENVLLWNAGLGDTLSCARIETGTATGRHHGGASRIAESGQLTMVQPIDLLGLENLPVLQLDVEGHELPALRGAERTIRGSSPAVLIEDLKDVCAPFLEGLGYAKVGEVPGLSAWAPPGTAGEISAILGRL